MGQLTKNQIAKLAAYKLLGTTSCVGCKFLYHQDDGYSNYTVENTLAYCAKGRNSNLPDTVPYDQELVKDNWPATKNSRCELYAKGELVCLDVDGENSVEGQCDDKEQIETIRAHSGRPR